MRASALVLASVLALTVAGCSPRQAAAPAPPAAPARPAALAPPETPPAAPAPPETPAPPAPPPKDSVVRFSPSDYGAHERRVTALVNNANSRDTSGETQYVAERGRSERERCATKACIERSYAAEEARLRKWEGSGDIK